MTADEIRAAVTTEDGTNRDWTDWSDAAHICALAEIAAQLAELNQHLRKLTTGDTIGISVFPGDTLEVRTK